MYFVVMYHGEKVDGSVSMAEAKRKSARIKGSSVCALSVSKNLPVASDRAFCKYPTAEDLRYKKYEESTLK